VDIKQGKGRIGRELACKWESWHVCSGWSCERDM